MDKLIFTALNSLGNLRGTQVVTAQNLANQNVPGFRRDTLGEGKAFIIEDQGALTSRAFQIEREQASFSDLPGFMNQTGEPLDLAIADKGYFYIQPDTGGPPALTRRGDLHVGLDGSLVNGANEAILGANQQPITIPPFRNIVVDEVGRITIEPIEGAPGERLEVATIATTLANGADLVKGEDGQIRPKTGPLPAADQLAKVRQGVLEGSNVNSTEELISSIDLQRSFELNMRVVSTAKELDEAGVSLMRLPG
ncbi:flagellar biosynthesis protein FlgF [Gemmobacter aquarius]|uniref:Flagellar basal-body rod protein FlgF n=1 Tax=Paragemmobacter aquarius TaxID=2169400 RepID=A0A2S0UPB3_9RHOB|nr:flagellar basal body rod C-terminal domain-containing protein [Gemmobacter aquarius]AWB49656.1 flagellar biosynthesis protein FlgF [Gemmobacter aquarius]